MQQVRHHSICALHPPTAEHAEECRCLTNGVQEDQSGNASVSQGHSDKTTSKMFGISDIARIAASMQQCDSQLHVTMQ